jgi:hypothetical protein
MFYIDDSGAEDTGWIVYAWIEVTPAQWSAALRYWLDMRKELYAKFLIPVATELHATKIAGGRSDPSTDPTVNRSKARLREALQDSLRSIQASPPLQIGAVSRQTTARGKRYHQERQSLYAALVAHLETRLEFADGFGMVFMDGDGTDRGYNSAHRDLKLATRRVIEDPVFQSSHTSQWMQMADMTAWTTYQGLLRYPGKEWVWNWYDLYLHGCDVNGGPLTL